jgi:hypothetical protein
VNIQSVVGYRVSFAMREVVLCKSCDVEIVHDAASVFNMGGQHYRGVGGKTRDIYSSSADVIHFLHFVS